MLELEIGTVKFFDNRRKKQFGFLFVLDADGNPTGEELFFHYNRGQWVDIVDDINGSQDIVFIGRRFDGQPVFVPKESDRIAFMRGENTRGPAASKWVHAEAYENRVRQLTEPLYRVIEITQTADGESREVFVEAWAYLLDEAYPVRVVRGELDDPLGHTEDVRYEFQAWHSSDEVGVFNYFVSYQEYWEVCPDPRTYSKKARLLAMKRDSLAIR